ncbi:MAG: hypothetical protein ACRDNZ_23935 [Streptosporangiaceae bacterium]
MTIRIIRRRLARLRRILRVSPAARTLKTISVTVAISGAAAALAAVYPGGTAAPKSGTRRLDAQGAALAISDIIKVSDAQVIEGLPPAGTRRAAFGVVSWTSAGPVRTVASIGQAQAWTGLALAGLVPPGPATLPPDAGTPGAILVQPKVTVTIRFGAGTEARGSTLVITAGPAALVQYASTSGRARQLTMDVAVARLPAATSTGAPAGKLEAFLLSQPGLLSRRGLPAGLAGQVRLLARPALPVPAPPGVSVQHVRVGGSPAVLLASTLGIGAGVIWESGDGTVHGVAGLLTSDAILAIARQAG